VKGLADARLSTLGLPPADLAFPPDQHWKKQPLTRGSEKPYEAAEAGHFIKDEQVHQFETAGSPGNEGYL